MKAIKKVLQNKRFSLILVTLLSFLKLITYYLLIEVNHWDLAYLILTIIIFVWIFNRLAISKIPKKHIVFLIIYTLLSILMFADSMYYNYYNQTVSVKQIWQAKNVASVPQSLVATLIPASIFLLLDIPFVYFLFKKVVAKGTIKGVPFSHTKVQNMKYTTSGIIILLLLLVINPLNSTLFKKINSVEFFSSHLNDIYLSLTEEVISEKISAEEILEIVEEIQPDIEEKEGPKYKGIGKGKNLILVQVESLQNFVINEKYYGQVLTPNLNSLIKKDSLYFNQYYSHIGKGNTADAEFSTLNSLYPVIDRDMYTLYEDNAYYGLPWILRDNNYKTLAFHGYKGEFWNREKAYPNQGIEEFYSMEDLDKSDIIGMGISDLSIFKQSVEVMSNIKEPFFSFIITLTNHHPYILPEDLSTIRLIEEHENTKFGSYLQTVRYTDYAIGEFIKELKAADLYDESIIVFYGDHHGLNYKMDGNEEIVSEFLGKPYDYDEMLNVPLIIHIPDSGINQTISTTGGFIDFLPTISNIMDFEIPHPYILGQDIANETDGFVAFTSYLLDGSFIHNDNILEISREGILE